MLKSPSKKDVAVIFKCNWFCYVELLKYTIWKLCEEGQSKQFSWWFGMFKKHLCGSYTSYWNCKNFSASGLWQSFTPNKEKHDSQE